jgi:hypothetical protein
MSDLIKLQKIFFVLNIISDKEIKLDRFVEQKLKLSSVLGVTKSYGYHFW